jgi:peptidyl-prolyl cis-trans isomerase D
MTMLDRMRRHKNWLKWSLALVCLAFVVFYIPDFLQPDASVGMGVGAVGPNERVASVNGRPISVAEFRRTYASQLQVYRGAYGANINEQMLRQLGIDQQILQQMIDERAALVEAERLGVSVSDEEVRERILSLPGLQENGRFIGEQRYRALLRMQSPPMTTADFEDNLRRSLIVQKLRSAVTDWMTLADAEAEAEFRLRNEKVKFDVVAVSADAFRPQAVVSDAEIGSHFDANKERYRIGEKRKIRFILLDIEAARAKVTIPPGDVERAYNDSIEQYSTPEQIRASHILLKTQGKDEATVQARAEDLVRQARAGADFAELARRNSEDEGSAPQGGDLDYFGRGRMVPEFERAAFEAAPDTIVGPVKTQFGFHVIKVVDKKPAVVQPFDGVRQQITDRLAYDRAQAQVESQSVALEQELRRPADLDSVAKAGGLTVQETGFFTRDEPVMSLGPAPEVNARAFELDEGVMSGAVRIPRGEVFFTVTGRQDAYVPKLEEVRDRVREDLVREKARTLARQKADEILPALKRASDLAAAAKAAGFEVRSTELVPRGTAIPGVGASSAIDRTAFSLPVGSVSDPVVTDTGVVIIRVVERKDVTPAELAAGREQFRNELLNDRRSRFFSAFMTKAKQRMRIEVDRETLQRVLGVA